MQTDMDHSDGSDTFWPGYVDAVTNLVLNLLFLLTIMTVAVFMFALELGRASLGGAGTAPVAATKPDAHNNQKKEQEATVDELKKQIADLQQELRLQQVKAAQTVPLSKVVPATSTVPKPIKGLDKTFSSDSEVIVRFTDEAVNLTQTELSQLREALKPIVKRGKARLIVEVPKGFSEAKRMGFYRAMAVRNLLLEMKVPKDRIELSIREGKAGANASIVRVSTPE